MPPEDTAPNVPHPGHRPGGVADVLRHDLCSGCGACTLIGPRIAMGLDGWGKLVPQSAPPPEADQVCPFSDHAPNEDVLAQEIGLGHLPKDDRLGHLDSTWAGHVVEGDFRARASSGGMATWIVTELLRTTRAEAVVHVHFDPEGVDRLFDFSVSRGPEEVRANAKTRYYPVSFDRAVAEVRARGEPFIFVGIPCHVKALNALARLDTELRDLLVARVSIFCGHMKTVPFAESLALQTGIPPSEMVAIDFRHKLRDRKASDYGVLVEARDGRRVERPMAGLVGKDWGKGYFRLKACDYCDDVVGETADISLGDAWLPDYVGDPEGTSVVISRRPELTALLRSAAAEGRIALDALSEDAVVASQAAGFRDRRDGLRYRLWLAERRGRWAPRKRFSPSRDHIPAGRRRMLRLRTMISRRSHWAWRMARGVWPWLFVAEGKLIESTQRAAGQAKRRLRRG